ncbi:MAG TPA: hypothetical protein DCL61_29995 [Cyanobacteria bacterium UBA12227]|nr:hypothetical protein [Cyanobacteria bacterium UBA12227]HAX88621.1 hypothetical protein [Cyanobacteria bacterium UBA11370]HBY77371.1 hypothetical protein [Cyanobacteria bacterium UBA11148]
MDPITIATVVLTLIATKAVEKVGEKLGEKTLEEGVKLFNTLQEKAPDTAQALKQVKDSEVIDAEIIEEVRQVAAREPEVQAGVNATADAVHQKAGGVTNLSKLAEKIGVLNQGLILNQQNTIHL